MEQNQGLLIRKDDFYKISNLLLAAPEQTRELLLAELDRATVVPDEELPKEVVAMHSTVSYLDLTTKKENEVTLVFPHEVNTEKNKISILAPVGAALIGLKVGQSIRWPLPNGKETEIKVTHVRSV